MSIISKDASLASSFMISYSSGKQEVYLQDGLVADYVLESKKMSTFYYVNQLSSSHVYLALSTASSNVLTGFKIKTYYLSDVSDKKSRV